MAVFIMFRESIVPVLRLNKSNGESRNFTVIAHQIVIKIFTKILLRV